MPVPVDAPTPPPVPGYTLQALLGRGSAGEVWRAVPRSGGKPVAVKLLTDGDPERQAREAVLLGALDHPHLVQLHEVVHQPRRGAAPRVALVLDLLEGGSLTALLARRGRLRPGEVVTTVSPVAAAVAHAHEQGVVHGDLSPGNIVFTGEGRPVLTDLGVARLLDEEAAVRVTPAYVDPTVARGGALGPASDVFGLAAAAFHALTGVAPWNGATPADVLAVATTGSLPDLEALAPEAPPELRAVVARGLAADPLDRGGAAAFALDLRHACRPEPVQLTVGGKYEQGGAGSPRPAELTSEVPGRRPRPVPQVVPPPRRWTPWLARRRPVGRHGAGERAGSARGMAVALLLATMLAGGAAVWLLDRGATPDATAGQPPRVEAPSGSASTTAGPGTTPAAAGTPAPTAVEPADALDPDPRSPASWRTVLDRLYDARAEAYASLSVAGLESVHTPGSSLRAADSAEITRLRRSGVQVRDFAPEVVEVRSATRRGDRVELQLVDRWPAYRVVGDDGSARVVPARRERVVAMVLLRGSDGWRIDTAGLLP